MKLVTIMIIGILIFSTIYTIIIFNSDFGVPNIINYNYGYPCDRTFIQDNNLFGYQFKNCYVLKLNFWNRN
jgi:hypothetical protein